MSLCTWCNATGYVGVTPCAECSRPPQCATCDFCGAPASEKRLELAGHGAHVACADGCGFHDHPRQRKVSKPCAQRIRAYELACDIEGNYGTVLVDVAHLRWLIETAREHVPKR